MLDAVLWFGGALQRIGPYLIPLLFLPLLVLAVGRPVSGAASMVFRTTDQISTAAMFLARASGVIIILAQLIIIIGRYVYGWSASWLNETVVYGFAALFLLAAPGALKADAHVRVDIFRGQMSARQKAAVDLAGAYLFLIPVCCLILWTVAKSSSFAESWQSLEGSRESDGLPVYFLFRTLIPLFAVLMLVQGLSDAIRSALILRGLHDEDAPPAHKQGIA
jgi:TRAP-type mannitol/chloroaromatic compound transport system permease small subunit